MKWLKVPNYVVYTLPTMSCYVLIKEFVLKKNVFVKFRIVRTNVVFLLYTVRYYTANQ